MLYKNDVVRIHQELDLPQDEYWVVAGAALVLHSVKETTGDVDIGCTNLAEHFIKCGCKYRVLEDRTRIVEVNDNVELIEYWFVDEIVYIETYPSVALRA